MKRIVWMMVLAFSFGLCLTACKGGGESVEYSETFEGAVSEKSYASADAAVKAFLEEEVSGDAISAKYVSYEKEADLTQEETEKLPLGDYAEGLQSAERGTVEYTDSADSADAPANTAAEETETVKRSVCILSYTDTFRYFVPPVAEGETLTASYCESVFDPEKYLNCTMEIQGQYEWEIDGVVERVPATTFMKVTEKAIYQKSYGNATTFFGAPAEVVKEDLEQYLISTDEGVAAIANFDPNSGLVADELYYGGPIGGDIKDYIEVCIPSMAGFDGVLDHTYFVKTDTGFANSAKFVEFLEAEGGVVEECEYVFHIADGRISDVAGKLTGELRGNNITHQTTTKFYDFGKTEVDVPAEVMALLPAEGKDSN